jgi:phosphomannomutase
LASKNSNGCEKPKVNPSLDLRFRCPGETYWIDRATHLARLATGYAGCRSCADRFETGGLLPAAARAADDTADRLESCRDELSDDSTSAAGEQRFCGGEAIWGAEGLAGTAENQIDAAVARRLAMALGTVLGQLPGAGSPVRVAVGGDGRWLSAPLVAAVSLGCQRAGCRVIETGNATTGSLAMVVRQTGLDGGILIGNAPSAPQTVSLKCFGPEGKPWSAGGGLEPVRRALADEAVRTSRRFGGLERIDLTAEYRQGLGELFHGLRPLRFVLDAASRPLVEHLRHLIARSACEIVSPGVPDDQANADSGPASAARRLRDRTATARKRSHGARPNALRARPGSLPARHVDRLRTQVTRVKADFGLWIDGDGDALVLVDERGRQIGPERLLWALVRPAEAPAGRPIVLARDVAPSGKQLFASAGWRVIEAEPTCEAVDAALGESGAAAAAGPGDRLWFAGQHPTSDALASVGMILQLLSGQDRPISAMLD